MATERHTGDRPVLPANFEFGVAAAGFQVEGGYNGLGEPRNNWFEWEETGKAKRSGAATRSWDRYEEDFAAAASLGCDCHRLSVEWARVKPVTEATTTEPPYDDAAVHRYVEMILAARRHGLEPMVTLHHFTHPAWLPADLWQRDESPALFARYAGEMVERLNRGLVEAGSDPIRSWITLNEINILGFITWFAGGLPGGGRLKARASVRATDNLLAAHVLGYDAVHDVYERNGWPPPQVTLNTYAFGIWELDRGLTDLLLARERGVERSALDGYMKRARDSWYEALMEQGLGPFGIAERISRAFAARFLALRLPNATAALYASSRDRKMDANGFDFYAPWYDGRFQIPGHRTAGGRSWLPARSVWDDPPIPDDFAAWCRLCGADDRPVWVVENGLATRSIDGKSAGRLDGWSRKRYIDQHLEALGRVVAEGVPVEKYIHWALYDNYEWGTYEPRFGIFGVEHVDGEPRRLDLDADGNDSAAAYREAIAAIRSGAPADV